MSPAQLLAASSTAGRRARTYWRGSSQIGQSARGSPYWTPQVTQIGSDTPQSCHGGTVSRQFIEANSVLLAFQALLVALTGAGIPPWLDRLKSRGWALILPVSIAGVVAGDRALPAARRRPHVGRADPRPAGRGAGARLGDARRAAGARDHRRRAVRLRAGCETGTLARRRGRGALHRAERRHARPPARRRRARPSTSSSAIVAMAVIDAILVFGNQLQGPNAVAQRRRPGRRACRSCSTSTCTTRRMGYGDVFVAGVLGGVLAAEGTQAVARRRCSCSSLAALWDLLFLLDSINTLPATVPIAVALIARRAETVAHPPPPWHLFGELIIVPALVGRARSAACCSPTTRPGRSSTAS